MQGTSGKKRLIYYHCVLGKDRTGGITLGYLLKNYPNLSYCEALTYTRYMGKTSGPTNYDDPNKGSLNLSSAYCNATRGNCTTTCNKLSLPGEALPDETNGKGTLYIVSYPSDATLLINGTDYGIANGLIQDIPTGIRNLTLTKTGYLPKSVMVTVPDKGVKVLASITLLKDSGEPAEGTGTLYVASYPSDATILINDTDYGKTNGFLYNVPAGFRNLTLTKPGYLPKSVMVMVPDKGVKVLPSITLSPTPPGAFSVSL
jgi:hypothetical protein